MHIRPDIVRAIVDANVKQKAAGEKEEEGGGQCVVHTGKDNRRDR